MSADLLQTAARALGPICDRVVFLGGATITLWLTDPAARPPRVTLDVDVVADVVTLGSYERFQQDLRDRGFAEAAESGVICRWNHPETGLILDAVPLESRLAGFAGKWHRPGVANAERRELPSGPVIRAVPPPFLLATKLEAFATASRARCLAKGRRSGRRPSQCRGSARSRTPRSRWAESISEPRRIQPYPRDLRG